MMIPARAVRPIPTGLICRSEVGYTLFVCSRSGMAKSQTLFVANAPGIVDPDYRGEVIILLYNGGDQPQWVEHEDRIAQLAIVPALLPVPHESPYDLRTDVTTRGDAGFGSTGR